MGEYMTPKMQLKTIMMMMLGLSMSACVKQHIAHQPTVMQSPPEPLVNIPAPPSATTVGKRLSNTAQSRRTIPMSPPYREVRGGAENVAEAQVQEQNTEQYQNNIVNPVHLVAEQPVSTFSVDVDTGSYSNVRRFLNQGRLPPVNAVRIEEMLNYFDYDYAQPRDQHPFAVSTETVDSPWKKDAKLIRIGIQAKDLELKVLPAANLVFLVDVSGSMNSEDKLPLVKHTLRILTEQLRPQDRVTIISYANGEKLDLPATSGNDKEKIIAVINGLQASGGTAGEQAIQMAYQQAQKSFIKDGINRILLATDGDFNVGITDFDTLKGLAAEKRKTGISLSTLGYGTGNYNEKLMEQLADAGDGNYSYIDQKNEAKKVMQRQLSSTLATVAQDVKIQVEFNPATVKEYRLVGYENRVLQNEDFNNDKVDAGDIGAGHKVTALYEIIPVGVQGWLEDSRYQKVNKAVASSNKNEYAFVKLRYKQPQQPNSILLSTAIPRTDKTLEAASADTRFAIAVAAYAQQLQGGTYNGAMGWDQIINLAKASSKTDPFQLRSEFVELVQIAKSLSAKAP